MLTCNVESGWKQRWEQEKGRWLCPDAAWQAQKECLMDILRGRVLSRIIQGFACQGTTQTLVSAQTQATSDVLVPGAQALCAALKKRANKCKRITANRSYPAKMGALYVTGYLGLHTNASSRLALALLVMKMSTP